MILVISITPIYVCMRENPHFAVFGTLQLKQIKQRTLVVEYFVNTRGCESNILFVCNIDTIGLMLILHFTVLYYFDLWKYYTLDSIWGSFFVFFLGSFGLQRRKIVDGRKHWHGCDETLPQCWQGSRSQTVHNITKLGVVCAYYKSSSVCRTCGSLL